GRQVLYDEADARVGEAKALAAARHLAQISAALEVDSRATELCSNNALDLLSDVDVIVDGSDNWEARRLANDVSVRCGIPYAYAAAVASYGSTAFLRPGKTACLRCLFSDADAVAGDTCDAVGVFSPAIGVIASMQVAEVLKYVSGREDQLSDRLVHVDAWHAQWAQSGLGAPHDDCPCCGLRQFAALEQPRTALAVSLCGRSVVQVRRAQPIEHFDLSRLAQHVRGAADVADVRVSDALLRFVVSRQAGAQEIVFTVFADGRALLQGLSQPEQATQLYDRYIGI
ncbi:MAG: ThiF family adenylyltransferase, partial [Firmicutes bacterium]|nr:ThiF family adenylyltransferase [Bacillota bacterium]